MLPTIAIQNESTLVDDALVAAACAAAQRQVSEHFAPIWGQDARLQFVAAGEVVERNCWRVVVVDECDEQGALGYHEVLKATPYGLVSVKPDLESGGKWTGTFSHEVLEMLADPFVDLTIMPPNSRKLYDREICDPVEDDNYGYTIDGVWLSDFVTPAWFGSLPGPPFDFQGHCTKPLQILKGGYIGQEHIRTRSLHRILQHNGRVLLDHLIPIGTRRWRRRHLFGREVA